LKLIAIYDDVSTKTSWEKQAIPRGKKKHKSKSKSPAIRLIKTTETHGQHN